MRHDGWCVEVQGLKEHLGFYGFEQQQQLLRRHDFSTFPYVVLPPAPAVDLHSSILGVVSAGSSSIHFHHPPHRYHGVRFFHRPFSAVGRQAPQRQAAGFRREARLDASPPRSPDPQPAVRVGGQFLGGYKGDLLKSVEDTKNPGKLPEDTTNEGRHAGKLAGTIENGIHDMNIHRDTILILFCR